MLSPMWASAKTVSDVQIGGCLSEKRAEEAQIVPTIVLTKEGNVLSVQLLNYESNCGTTDFIVTPNISSNEGETWSLTVNVDPVIPQGMWCTCPFNVSFTVRDLEPNSFYLDCWWYKGQVKLTEGEALVLDGQEREYYYYYQGKRIPLTLNENKVVVSIPKEYDGISKRIRANLPVLSTIKDGVFDSFIIPRSDFERLTSQDFWEEDAKSMVLTSSYYTEDKTEVFETPYLNVRLKKEEDADLLASYAERYGLKIVGNSNYLPLWYILYVTPGSEKSPLQCANEIFESGEFTSAVADFAEDVDFEIGIAYRPFVEDGKVWKVGTIPTVSGNPVQVVDYYYFAGDTIVGGKTCKQMMCQRYVSPGFSDAAPSLTKVGAWYEEDKKVYRYYARDKQFRLWYDFSADANDTLQIYEDHPPYIISPRKTGGIKGFKGIYRDVMMTYEGELLNYNISTWMEGVGNIAGPIYCVYIGEELYKDFLMSCTVGDEVIYLNDEYEDGATPEAARKDRIDFTHTIKIRPKSRIKREAESKSLYGEYNDLLLGINLNALDEAYQVSITDEAGKTVYEKTVNAGSIVGLNIDISAYAKGRYTVTVENSNESFTGQFETLATGIEENVRIEKFKNGSIYNLQGQRINSLRKGLNIMNGQKIFVK